MLKLLPQNKKTSYEDFYAAHYNQVLNYTRNKVTVAEDAEDLVSDVFLYCYHHYENYDPEKSSMTTWLYLILNSRIKNYYRDHVTYADYEVVSDVMQDESIDLDQGVYLEQLHSFIMKAIRSLPQRQQTIITMRYFEDRSTEEIATALGITPGNVRVLLSRALDKLSSRNEAYWKEFKTNG